jgi:DNA-directed RNA polymerase sigma subunit (sigma70/sigma32)
MEIIAPVRGTTRSRASLNVAAQRRRGEGTTMTETETAVLRLRYGEARRVATLQEVAGLLGISLRAVRHIEHRALCKLRRTALGPVARGFDGWDEA